MSDDVLVTAGSGTTIATDERTIAAVLKHVQRVDEQGGTAIASARVNVTTTAALAIAARETRKVITLYSLPSNTADIDIGPSSVISGSNFPLAPGATMDILTTAVIWADAASGTQVLAYMEVYDT